MLGYIRNFSTSIYAKILLGIVIIPFVFWGMGSSLSGGSKNIIVIIDKEKYTIDHFGNFIKSNANSKITSEQIEVLLTAFISEKIVEKEINYFKIKLSDKSLGKLLKNQKDFKKDGKFSRTEYEKFLIKNNITAANFEYFLAAEEKRKQLLNFISGGLVPTDFLINNTYDRINQKRSIKLINLDKTLNKDLVVSNKKANEYFEENKSQYTKVYKSIIFLELNPNTLVNNNEFTDLFFKKIDEIDDLVMQGNKLESITNKFNLTKPPIVKIDINGKKIDETDINIIPKNVLLKIFNMEESESTMMIEDENKYFLAEVIKTENIQLLAQNKKVQNDILKKLKYNVKRRLIAEIIAKINSNNFNKEEFDIYATDNNINIQEIKLENNKDDKILKKEILYQIYAWPEKKVIVVNQVDLSENYLVYIDKVNHVKIDNNSEEYKNYSDLAKSQLANRLYHTYDNYIKKKYKIEINYKTLNTVKNYYN
jgi:peptidyl-prolyl cis-trans isomerase D